jgi:predicted MFS family arabinose efflux permease
VSLSRDGEAGAPKQGSEWAVGWPLVLVGVTGAFMSTVHAGVLGAAMPALQAEFGWGRAEISAPILLYSVFLLLVGPVIGALIDRIGARRIALVAPVLYCAAIAGVGASGPRIMSWYLAWLCAAAVLPAVGPVLWTLNVSRCFDRHRGLALATVLSGVGIANFVVPLFAAQVASTWGWRAAFFATAAGTLLIVWPAVARFYHPRAILESRAASRSRAGESPAMSGYASAYIIRSPRFWALATAMLLVAAAVGGLTLHFQPFLRDAGMTAQQAAGYASIIGPATIIGRLAGGYFLDRFTARYVAAVIFSFPIAVCVIFLHFDGSPLQSVLAAAVLGLAYGAEADMLAYLTARYFGLKNYGFSFGILVGIYSLGFGIAPVLAGAIFDAFHAYDAMFYLTIIGVFICVSITLGLGRPPDFGALSDDDAQPGGATGLGESRALAH